MTLPLRTSRTRTLPGAVSASAVTRYGARSVARSTSCNPTGSIRKATAGTGATEVGAEQGYSNRPCAPIEA